MTTFTSRITENEVNWSPLPPHPVVYRWSLPPPVLMHGSLRAPLPVPDTVHMLKQSLLTVREGNHSKRGSITYSKSELK